MTDDAVRSALDEAREAWHESTRVLSDESKPQTRACALGVKTVPADRQGAML